jgi:hypothetical protein
MTTTDERMFPKTMHFRIPDKFIVEGLCGLPTKCAVKLTVKEKIGGHGYVSVDAGGVSISRRPDCREKAFMPKPLLNWVVNFDAWKEEGADPKAPNRPKPIPFTLTFHKTTKIVHRDNDQVNANRKMRAAAGKPDKKYGMRKRIAGVALALKAKK